MSPLPLPSLKMDAGQVSKTVGRTRCRLIQRKHQQRVQSCKAFLEWCGKHGERLRGRTGVIRLGPNSGNRALADFNLFLDMTLRHSCCSHFTGPVRVCKDKKGGGGGERHRPEREPGLGPLCITRRKSPERCGSVAGKRRREKGLLEAGEKQELRSCVYLTLSEHLQINMWVL